MARSNLLLLLAIAACAQMPKGLPNRDSYAIRAIKEGEPCRFAAEYERVKGNKRDPRVAFVEIGEKLEGETGLDFDAFCRLVSDQAEDSIATYDAKNGFFQMMTGRADVNWAVASFGGQPGVVMLVKREAGEWRTWVFEFVGGQWQDVTARLWKSKHYPLLPQYGRTIRLLQGIAVERPRHAGWLSWNGKAFVTASGAGWRCPDSYRYFAPSERAAYCRP
jgi:hypothetical protein